MKETLKFEYYNSFANFSHPFELDFTNSNRQNQGWVTFPIGQDPFSAIVTDTLKIVVIHGRKEVVL